jgi:fructan beta-fructosidase
MVYHEGEYHLFYQHHPASTVWGPMHWGHAVSRDLVRWEELPIALAPDDIGTIFSGSAVIDRDNTAGFGANAMVAVFTHHTEQPERGQLQSLAYSLDRGRTWTKYAGNPVLIPPEAQRKDFRDPKVFWYDDGANKHWVMALAVSKEIWFYQSKNLKDWTESSRFGLNAGSHGGVWECPELVQLSVEGTDEKRWVMIVSVGNGAPAGGSGVQYFVGQFDGVTFTAQDAPERIRWADYGADFYAPQAWNDAPNGRKLALAWMNNWSYANQVPDDGGYRGAMSTPRELSLRRDADDLVLIQLPVRELERLRQPCAAWDAKKINGEVIAVEEACGATQEIQITFRLNAATPAGYFGLRVRGNADGGAVVIGYNTQHNKLIINRAAAGPKVPGFAAPHLAPLLPRNGAISLRVLVDQSSLEVFADDGRVVMTEQIFPKSGSEAIAVFAEDGAVEVESLVVYRLGAH